MPSQWIKFTLLFVIASGLLLAGFLLAWYPHSVIENKEALLSQGGLTQSELNSLEGSLVWWRAQGIFYYGSASNFIIIAGILVLVYAILYSILYAWKESIKDKKAIPKHPRISQVKSEERATNNFQYEKTRKNERINYPVAGGLLTIIASCIVMIFSGVLVVGEIFIDNSQVITLGVNALADGMFGILVSAIAITGVIMILKRKKFVFTIIAICFMMVKGVTFIISTGGGFWGLFIGTDVFVLTVISLIFTSIAYKEFS